MCDNQKSLEAQGKTTRSNKYNGLSSSFHSVTSYSAEIFRIRTMDPKPILPIAPAGPGQRRRRRRESYNAVNDIFNIFLRIA